MEGQAAEKLGEPVQLVATVSSKGTAKSIMTAGVARQLGGAIGAATAGTLTSRGSLDTITGHKGYMVLALTESKLAFFKQKSGLLKPSCGDLLGSLTREDITAFELGGGALTAPLSVKLSDGTELEFEVPRAHKGKVEKVKQALSR
jgi:hypothetical protein